MGLSVNEGVPAEYDSVVVQVLKLQGAVPFVHTNVPQSMFRLGLVGVGWRQGHLCQCGMADPSLLLPAMTAVTPSTARPQTHGIPPRAQGAPQGEKEPSLELEAPSWA